jgi:hypothetical protein
MRHFPTLRLALAFLSLLVARCSFARTVDVLYVSTTHAVTTYTVDPVSGLPSEVGNPLTTPNKQFLQAVIPAPDDRFIYVISSDAEFGLSHYFINVYATDGSGVPQEPPVQTIAVKLWGFLRFLIHPSGKYAYALETYTTGQEYASTLYLYHIDTATGMLTQDPKVQATYGPDYAYLELLVGFNGTGTRLYDDWNGYFGHGESRDNYSYHRISGDTGALSADVGFFGTANYDTSSFTVFTDKLILVAVTNAVYETELYVYKNVKYPQEPLFTCTQAMLHACYTAEEFWVSPDQQYVFLPEWQGTFTGGQTVVARIDVAGRQLVKMWVVPGIRWLYFSPDDKLIYGAGWDQPIQVYRFNSNNGAVEPGGSITAVTPYSVWPAVRQ